MIGFVISIGVVAGAAGFILWAELRTSDHQERLVADALRRAGLISRIRVNALALESAIEAHIRASSDAQRDDAATVMSQILTDLRQFRASYFESRPPQRTEEREVWDRFEERSLALATHVQEAQSFSNLQQAERARRHLVEQVQPLLVELDAFASKLSRFNEDEASELQRALEVQRRGKLFWSGGVLVAAITFALLLGLAMSLLMRRQAKIIAAQIDELDARNQELDAFAARVAHDLVSPLAPLQGHLTVARRSREVRASPELSTHLERAQQSVARMAGLVEALLRFCRAGTRSESAPAGLDVVVTSQLLEVAQIAAAENVELERHITRSVTVDCPSQLLHCIAQNVLSNAVKYTAGTPAAKVRVEVSASGGNGLLVVEDNGPGMSAEIQAQLFRPFFRAPGVREKPGYGLGLATTKRLVDAHGGRLILRSDEGKGTRVEIQLPAIASTMQTHPKETHAS
ncbi:MAG: ATP-binding protein [Myxococcaceae bacterium]